MFILFFALWIVFSGMLTLESMIFGLVISGVMYWFLCKFMDFSIRKEKRFWSKIGKTFCLLWTLLVEIVKANIMAAKWVYSSKAPDSCVIRFRAPLKSNWARVALADCITLTPGTITGSLEDNTFVVHCLDASMGDGIDQSVFVQQLSELEA
jgi:multicomponent Na+:H+ antiporter subunit E